MPTNPSAGLMPLDTAQRYAAHLVAWLAPLCDRIEIAGSIRRQRPFCADVDLVCIPHTTEYKDLLGHVIGLQISPQLFLQNYIADYQASHAANMAQSQVRIITGSAGAHAGVVPKQMIVQLPKCQLDLWFADQSTFATRLLCRTGSKEHNIWLCQRATERSMHWNPYEGLTTTGPVAGPLPAGAEADIYGYLGLGFIAPKDRESSWIAQNLESHL